MRDALSFWRSHRDVRPFFLAHAQGAIGDGAGYVALLLLAYDRFGSAWAATALALADFGPAMLLGPLLGALVDRHGRLRSAIVSDAIRAVAFAGPAVRPQRGRDGRAGGARGRRHGALPSRDRRAAADADDERASRGAANALTSMLRDGGQLLGPALAAACC